MINKPKNYFDKLPNELIKIIYQYKYLIDSINLIKIKYKSCHCHNSYCFNCNQRGASLHGIPLYLNNWNHNDNFDNSDYLEIYYCKLCRDCGRYCISMINQSLAFKIWLYLINNKSEKPTKYNSEIKDHLILKYVREYIEFTKKWFEQQDYIVNHNILHN